MNKKITTNEISKMSYVNFLALLNETNRPPGGKDSVRRLSINSFIDNNSLVLHSGCNTGFCSFEISHITKCKVKAIDINKNMILSAQKKLEKELDFFKKRISFNVANAHSLPFKNDSFDLVFSGGSTAFMKDPEKVVKEYKRVCKPYGFVGDICLFYKKQPSIKILNKINNLLDIKIQPWNKDYWVSLYTKENLEPYYDYTDDMPYNPTQKEVREYSRKMVEASLGTLSEKIKKMAEEKLYKYTKLFNENHKFLGYSVLLFRKDYLEEQITLFGK